MGTFSTFFSHHMATMEGGFITTDDEELYHILLVLELMVGLEIYRKKIKSLIKVMTGLQNHFDLYYQAIMSDL